MPTIDTNQSKAIVARRVIAKRNGLSLELIKLQTDEGAAYSYHVSDAKRSSIGKLYDSEAEATVVGMTAMYSNRKTSPAMEWISVSDRMPETRQKVLVAFINECGKPWQTIADYIAPRTVLSEDYINEDNPEFVDYDKVNGVCYAPSGWYEFQYESEMHYHLSCEVTHWMPLPDMPDLD